MSTEERPSSTESQALEGTLAIIKPDAVHKATPILKRISEEGFLIVEKQRMNFSRQTSFLNAMFDMIHFLGIFRNQSCYITYGDKGVWNCGDR